MSGTAVRQALYNKLKLDPTLNGLLGPYAEGYNYSIYHGVAPEGAGFPYVLFNKQSGHPEGLFAAIGDDTDEDVWLVKAVVRAPSADAAETISARIMVLLDGKTLPNLASLLYLRRQSDVDYGEVIEGVQYRHSGALYRLVVT